LIVAVSRRFISLFLFSFRNACGLPKMLWQLHSIYHQNLIMFARIETFSHSVVREEIYEPMQRFGQTEQLFTA
jgi:hypothetical protein